MWNVKCEMCNVTNAQGERNANACIGISEPSIWYLSEARVQMWNEKDEW